MSPSPDGVASPFAQGAASASDDRAAHPSDDGTVGRARDRPALSAEAELARLDQLVRTLRSRCPWDRSQTHLSLAPHLLEEAYETFDAIEDLGSSAGSASSELVAHLAEELGDLLIQVFFHCVLAEEEGVFDLALVAKGVHDKMVRRHPHVFGDATADTAQDVSARWEVLKDEEEGRKKGTSAIPEAMPALALTAKLLRRARSSGVQLPSTEERLSAARFALEHLGEHLGGSAGPGSSGDDAEVAPVRWNVSGGVEASEVGELLVAVADLAERAGVDPEAALRAKARGLRRVLEVAQEPG